jgi:hypothetical protein
MICNGEAETAREPLPIADPGSGGPVLMIQRPGPGSFYHLKPFYGLLCGQFYSRKRKPAAGISLAIGFLTAVFAGGKGNRKESIYIAVRLRGWKLPGLLNPRIKVDPSGRGAAGSVDRSIDKCFEPIGNPVRYRVPIGGRPRSSFAHKIIQSKFVAGSFS